MTDTVEREYLRAEVDQDGFTVFEWIDGQWVRRQRAVFAVPSLDLGTRMRVAIDTLDAMTWMDEAGVPRRDEGKP